MIAFGILFGWDTENHYGWQFGRRVLCGRNVAPPIAIMSGWDAENHTARMCGRNAAPPTIAYLQGLGAEQIYRGRFARRFAVDAPSYLGRV